MIGGPTNQRASGKGGIPSLVTIERTRPAPAEHNRSPTARVASRHSEVPEGRQVVAQAKWSAVLGQSTEMNSSLFSKLCWLRRRNFEKREINGDGALPRTATFEALSWAIIELPLRGIGRSLPEANKALDRMTSSAVTQLFRCDYPWRGPRHRSALRSAAFTRHSQ